MTGQLRLDRDTARVVDLTDGEAHAIASMLRASAAAFLEYPLRSTNAVEANSRSRHAATARRVADLLLGLLPDDETDDDQDEAA